MTNPVENNVSKAPATTMCPACSATSENSKEAWTFRNARGETVWRQCTACHAYFMDRPYDYESEVTHTQQMTWGDAQKGRELNSFKRRMYKSILNRLLKLRPTTEESPRRLLDIGCSYGGFMMAAADAGYDVRGFDIVPEAVQFVCDEGLLARCCGCISEYPANEGQFDVITVLDSNIYWPDQDSELNNIFARLKPGGLLLMRVVDKSWMASIGCKLQGVAPRIGERVLRRAVNDHRFSMPLRSMLRVLKDHGFEHVSGTPNGAVHSDRTSAVVKASFAVGAAVWKMTGAFVAPGAIVVAEKPADVARLPIEGEQAAA